MDCSEVKQLLSAYYDDELSSEKRASVDEHLSGCNDCTRELESFRNLSAMADRLSHPEAPIQIWSQLSERLSAERKAESQQLNRWSWIKWTGTRAAPVGVAVAVAILIAVVWFGSRPPKAHNGDAEFAAVFDQYLKEFRRSDQAAQQFLLAKYEHQAVAAEQAIDAVGYRPAVADGLPAEYAMETTYVMKMPCCTCVQCQCHRSDGTAIAVFEHNDDEPHWFGDRPHTEVVCSGTTCTLVELDENIAASWKRGDRYMTVIGLRDKAEVDRLVAWFDDRKRIRLQQQ